MEPLQRLTVRVLAGQAVGAIATVPPIEMLAAPLAGWAVLARRWGRGGAALTVGEFLAAIESQTPLRPRFAGCGNSRAIFWGLEGISGVSFRER